MSESKLVMARKLSNVQQSLMSMEFEDTNLQTLLPLIFKECVKENLTFWFSFIENTAILNLRDVQHDNYELNIRQYYDGGKIEDFKKQLLLNTFLIIPKSVPGFQNQTPAEDMTDDREKILSSDKPIPGHIRKAIKTIESKGIPITKESIQNHLPLGKMSTSARMECNKYLNENFKELEA